MNKKVALCTHTLIPRERSDNPIAAKILVGCLTSYNDVIN